MPWVHLARLFQGETAAKAEKQSFRHICLEVDEMQATVAELRARGGKAGEIKLEAT